MKIINNGPANPPKDSPWKCAKATPPLTHKWFVIRLKDPSVPISALDHNLKDKTQSYIGAIRMPYCPRVTVIGESSDSPAISPFINLDDKPEAWEWRDVTDEDMITTNIADIP